MATTIRATVNGLTAELVHGGAEWPVTIGGCVGEWNPSFGLCGDFGSDVTDQVRAELEDKIRAGLAQLRATRPSLRPAVLEVA